MSDTTTIDEIMEDMYWEYKNSSESYCLIPNRVRHILTRHLAPQPSVSELIEKREKKEIPFPDSYGDLMDMFLADLRHLKPQSEEVEIGEKNINIRWYNNYYSCKCWCHDIQEWYNYCPWCWKKIKRVD